MGDGGAAVRRGVQDSRLHGAGRGDGGEAAGRGMREEEDAFEGLVGWMKGDAATPEGACEGGSC